MKIIGYKLVKPEYLKAALEISGIIYENYEEGAEFLERYLKKEWWGDFKKALEEAGVLDLWFEPVYETPQIPKGSDAEKFVEMVGCKQKYTKDIGCGKITFIFETLYKDRVDVHFNLDGTFSHIYSYITP